MSTMSTQKNKFTETELKILAVLRDGEKHDKYELHKCLPNSDSELVAIQPHLSRIRSKLPNNQLIVPEFYRGLFYYRWVEKLRREE